MARFQVTIKQQGREVVRRVQSQNTLHAAACGLSQAGGKRAEAIEVLALAPAPGRPALVVFEQCSQGVYGFCYGACSLPEPTKGGRV